MAGARNKTYSVDTTQAMPNAKRSPPAVCCSFFCLALAGLSVAGGVGMVGVVFMCSAWGDDGLGVVVLACNGRPLDPLAPGDDESILLDVYAGCVGVSCWCIGSCEGQAQAMPRAKNSPPAVCCCCFFCLVLAGLVLRVAVVSASASCSCAPGVMVGDGGGCGLGMEREAAGHGERRVHPI